MPEKLVRSVETHVTGSGSRLFRWADNSWRTVAPPDVFRLALDAPVAHTLTVRGQKPVHTVADLVPTIGQVSALSPVLLDFRPMDEYAPFPARAIHALLSQRYYRHLDIYTLGDEALDAEVCRLVAAGQTPILLHDYAVYLDGVGVSLGHRGFSVGLLEWVAAPKHHSPGTATEVQSGKDGAKNNE